LNLNTPSQQACNPRAYRIRGDSPLEVRRKFWRKGRWHRMLFELQREGQLKLQFNPWPALCRGL
jgi:hypothetical protein